MFQKENKDMPFGWAVFCLAFLFVSMIGSVVFKMNIPTHINLLASISITLLVAWLMGALINTVAFKRGKWRRKSGLADEDRSSEA